MCELKKIGKVFTSKFVGTGPSSYEKGIYRAAVSQRLRNTALNSRLKAGKLLTAYEESQNACQSVVVLLFFYSRVPSGKNPPPFNAFQHKETDAI
jgi:hypothetical protein